MFLAQYVVHLRFIFHWVLCILSGRPNLRCSSVLVQLKAKVGFTNREVSGHTATLWWPRATTLLLLREKRCEPGDWTFIFNVHSISVSRKTPSDLKERSMEITMLILDNISLGWHDGKIMSFLKIV